MDFRKFFGPNLGFSTKKGFKIRDPRISWYPFGTKNHEMQGPQKMLFRYFLAVFELLSDSLTAIYVELHQCPSHHSILLTQGPIWEIFAKKFWELAILKNELFLSRPFWIFFSKKNNFFFASFPWKLAQIYMVEWIGRNFNVFSGF